MNRRVDFIQYCNATVFDGLPNMPIDPEETDVCLHSQVDTELGGQDPNDGIAVLVRKWYL